jgi:hypothetical protein
MMHHINVGMKNTNISTKFESMKRWPIALLVLLFLGCGKTELNKNDYADITYELQTNTGGFSRVQYGKFTALSNGYSGVQMTDWLIINPGTYTQTESIRKGFIAEISAKHATSGDWSLKIKSANGTVLRSATPSFIADSNFYFATISVPAQ